MSLHDAWLRVRAVLFPARAEQDLHDELAFHLERQVRKNIQSGMDPDEARRAARRKFGHAALVAEECRDERRIAAFDHLQRDVRHALRSLSRNPGFTAVAVLTLTLGIGANTALFTIADPLLTRPLPVEDPGELVLFRTIGSPAWADSRALVPYALYERLQSGSTTLASVLAFEYQTGLMRKRIRDDNGAAPDETVWAMPVTGSFFQTLGVTATAGRVFTPSEDRSGAVPVAVISYGLWQRRYGRDPGVIGRTVSLVESTRPGLRSARSPRRLSVWRRERSTASTWISPLTCG